MPVTIGSNIASLRAQRQLSKASQEVGSVFERLSSGLRINRASDDAAGLSIAQSLKTDRRIFTQGIRNFNDGLSLLNIADRAISSLSDIVTRLKELAEQAANGTYSKTQRKALDAEAQALSKEYTRVIQTTKFNGISLLNGSLPSLSLQGGYGQSGSILSNLGGAIGTGTFGQAISIAGTFTPAAQIAGDFNNDGNMDIASAEGNFGLAIYLGNGSGSLTLAYTYAFGLTRGIAMTDFNNDGQLDLVTTDIAGGVNTFLGSGNGTFQLSASLAAGADPNAVTAGDFNGDGNADIASTDVAGNRTYIMLGNGSGTFTSFFSFANSGAGYDIVTDDFNGDGILDLVNTNFSNGYLDIQLGIGDGTFGSRTTYLAGTNAYRVRTGDFNGDGKVDLVTADQGSDTISIFLGNGNGTFGARTSYAAGDLSDSIVVGDFNGDGIQDIVSNNESQSQIITFIGNGNGTFTNFATTSTNAIPTNLAAADLNNDGVLDIITAHFTGNYLGINLGKVTSGTSILHEFSLATVAEARQALSSFNVTLKNLGLQRGQIGGFQSRVEVGINNLRSLVENYAAAESRIMDADIADETSRLVRLQILQQASAAILAQANQQPALVLKLLNIDET